MSKRFKIILTFLLLCFSVFIANSVFATAGETEDLSIQLSGALGGVVSGLPEFIERLYNYMIALAGGLATVMIMIGGFIYLTAAGDQGRITKAKEMISNALIGLFLTVGAFVILNTINPATLTLKMPEIGSINRVTTEYVITPEEKRAMGSPSLQIGCTRGDEPIPLDIGNTESWCEELCTGRSHLGHEILSSREIGGSTHSCCHCTEPTEGAPTGISGGPGSEKDCLVEVMVGRALDRCNTYSGTDGYCVQVGEWDETRRCNWEPTTCENDAGCVTARSAHCWEGRCYQAKLNNGEACNSGGAGGNDTACLSGSCERAGWNNYYCAPTPSRPQKIPLDGLCDDGRRECFSGNCGISPGTDRNRKQCY